jgi:hypothetical protein
MYAPAVVKDNGNPATTDNPCYHGYFSDIRNFFSHFTPEKGFTFGVTSRYN